jgi:formylglycine-generating enzyme required for sulfatase activity
MQIVDTLDVHEIWYDQRLYPGQNWWKEILRKLDWCDGFVYLLSPDSVNSQYCQREFEIAQQLGRAIFPVLIRENTALPPLLKDLHYANLSRGITAEGVKTLLNSIYLHEQQQHDRPYHDYRARSVSSIPTPEIKQPQVNLSSVVTQAAQAMEAGQYDQAVFYLKQAKANGYTSKYINIDAFLAEAEEALDKQSWLIEADREYRQISEMIRLRATRMLALEAFLEFRKQYPDYDPDSLADAYRNEMESLRLGNGGPGRTASGLYVPEGAKQPMPPPEPPAPSAGPTPLPYLSEPVINSRSTGTHQRAVDSRPVTVPQAYSAPVSGRGVGVVVEAEVIEDTAQAPVVGLPLLEWCAVPAGGVRLMVQEKDGRVHERVVNLPGFHISKYPVTIAQYQLFLDDPSGYSNIAWWGFSAYANHWRMNNPAPKAARFKGDDRPREMVNWYDAMAFCHWASATLGQNIALPTSAQWQRAFQGDDARAYPWGNRFDKDRCNTAENNLKMTTIVMRYDDGRSPYGVYDMAGNVWEWCVDSKHEQDKEANIGSNEKRIVRGGSFMSPSQRSQVAFLYDLDPASYHASIGFRIVDLG